MTRRRIELMALITTLALLFAPVSAAQADTQSADGFRFIGNRCSWGATWVTNEWANPGLESVATIDASVFAECDRKDWSTQPGEAIAVAQQLVGWDARGWEFVCDPGRWIVHDGRNGQRHEVRTWWNFWRPCNSFWYKGRGYAATFFGGDWFGDARPPVDTPWIQVR